MYKLWAGIFSISLAVALWFAVLAALQFWQYTRLDKQTFIHDATWKVQEISPSKFLIEVTYNYTVGDRDYPGKTLFETNPYPNPYAAKLDLPGWEKQQWRVWYVERHPEVSSLQKTVPTKALIHAILTLGVCVYFYLLRSLENSSWVRGLRTPRSKRL